MPPLLSMSMQAPFAVPSAGFFCHQCRYTCPELVATSSGNLCPRCQGGFVEDLRSIDVRSAMQIQGSVITRIITLIQNLQIPLQHAAPRQVVEALPLVLGDCQNVQQLGDCVICCEGFAVGDVMIQLPQCQHIFHSACLREWLARADTCPICRSNISNPPHLSLTAGLLEAHHHTHGASEDAEDANDAGTPRDSDEDDDEDEMMVTMTSGTMGTSQNNTAAVLSDINDAHLLSPLSELFFHSGGPDGAVRGIVEHRYALASEPTLGDARCRSRSPRLFRSVRSNSSMRTGLPSNQCPLSEVEPRQSSPPPRPAWRCQHMLMQM